MRFDLTSLLGRSVTSSEARILLEYFEETPVVSERDEELDGRYYIEFLRSGFSLLVTGSNTVQTVHIYLMPEGEYAPCIHAVPFDLCASTTQSEARDLFGHPSAAGGPVRAILPPKGFLYWDRWEYAQHSFHLTYPERRDSTLLITLEHIPAPPA